LDAIIVGALTAAGAVSAALAWQLWVHPERLLALWAEPEDDELVEEHPAAVRAARCAAAGLVVLLGFLTGLALSFLTST